MSRQSIAVTVVIAVLGLLLVARAMVGHGMGRVYSETRSVDMVEVDVPSMDPMSVDEDKVRAGDMVTVPTWIPASRRPRRVMPRLLSTISR